MLSGITMYAIVAATVAAVLVVPPNLSSRAANLPALMAHPAGSSKRDKDHFIPTTNMPMTNVFQGFMDECANDCRSSAVCLSFPWAYQTCFDIRPARINFSYDHLGLTRLQCDITVAESERASACPKDQVCLPRIWPQYDLQTKLEGWCIQRNVYQMNYDAFCKGRYQKTDGVWESDMRGKKRPAMYLKKPTWHPSATFDQNFDAINKGSMPPACKENPYI